MISGSKDIDRRRLSSRLSPKDAWGPYVGMWATTYEMQPEFFETDYLPSILDLGAWDDRHWTSRVAMEKELAGMESAAVMLDAQGYPGRPRSLRVEIRPAKAPGASRMHAKVTVVVHENAVRLIVGSANLTEPGYRHNIEVAATLAATAKDPSHARLITNAVSGAKAFLQPWWSEGVEQVCQRALTRLDSFERSAASDSEWFAWSGGRTRLWQSFLQRWPQQEPVEKIIVVSPFWSDENGSGPLAGLLNALQTGSLIRGPVRIDLVTDAMAQADNHWLPVLPPSYAGFDFEAAGAVCFARPVNPQVRKEEIMREDFLGTRRLHAKVVLFDGPQTSLAYLGSANFTHKGWGFLPGAVNANIEAGLILRRTGSGRSDLRALIPAAYGEPIRLGGTENPVLGVPPPKTAVPDWPGFVRDVRLAPTGPSASQLELVVHLDHEKIEGSWRICFRETDEVICQSAAEALDTLHTPLSPEHLKRLLMEQDVRICWWQCPQGIHFPINVQIDARDGLPISPDSRGPNEQMLLAYYQGRITFEELFPPEDNLDTNGNSSSDRNLQSVDTSKIQSYQIREFVESLEGIRQDLRGARHSQRSMKLALTGPVSPVALARLVVESVHQGARTPTAGGFQLVEILCCLKEAALLEEKKLWEKYLLQAQGEVESLTAQLCEAFAGELGTDTMFDRYRRCLCGNSQEKRKVSA